MSKIIAISNSLPGAQDATKRLATIGINEKKLSIFGRDSKPSLEQSTLKESLVWGSALGAGLALLLPHGGISLE